MSPIYTLLVMALIAGLAMPLGALLAKVEHIKKNWLEEEFRHAVMAFGGGSLMSAVALVLVPEGIVNFSPLAAASFFIAGGFAFMLLDILLHKINTPASQLAAMLADFIPESIALGAAFALGSSSAVLLAFLIALQNLPEGFNAFRELKQGKAFRANKVILLFALMALLGPLCALSGYIWLAEYPKVVSAIMLFAAGGILYSLFQDIAPQVKLEKFWAPPMGAILGFVLGMVGFMLS